MNQFAPKEIDYIVNKLPALKPGNFLLISPDEYDKVQTLNVRWLVTQHVVISEHQISDLVTDELKNYYLNEENSSVNNEDSVDNISDTEPSKNDIHDQEKPEDEITFNVEPTQDIDDHGEKLESEEKEMRNGKSSSGTSISVVRKQYLRTRCK